MLLLRMVLFFFDLLSCLGARVNIRSVDIEKRNIYQPIIVFILWKMRKQSYSMNEICTLCQHLSLWCFSRTLLAFFRSRCVCVCVVTVAYCSMPTETDNRPARKNRYYCTHKYAQCFVTIQKPNNKNDTEKNVIHKW